MVKIERSYPAPKSLESEAQKPSGSYSEPDVVERLKNDFYHKCYLCELKNLQDPEIEHLLPHKQGKYPERKFNWDNLFWSCGHCNKVKSQTKYDEKILDCCREDPEKVIHFSFKDNHVHVYAVNEQDVKAVMTAELIQEVFNIKNTGMRVYKSDMRFRELSREMNLLYDNLENWKRKPDSRIVLRKLRALLRRESKFAAFKRNYIRENKSQYSQLLPYIEETIL